METITIDIAKELLAKMQYFYEENKKPTKNQYLVLYAKVDKCTISVYSSLKVVFQGEKAQEEASIWSSQTSNPSIDNQTQVQVQQIKQPTTTFVPHAGSDEVGTGDYFGPVCVCACRVNQEEYELIKAFRIDDSKQIKDDIILQIAPKLMELLPYSLLVLDNHKYNQIHEENNMNAIKAKLHNQAYLHLQNKVKELPALCVIDQFTPKQSYFRYLKDEPSIITTLHFETKAESKYLAVACASMIARYAFLKSMESLEVTYQMKLAKGASSKVDQVARDFIAKHGKDKLKYVTKLHFANTSKL